MTSVATRRNGEVAAEDPEALDDEGEDQEDTFQENMAAMEKVMNVEQIGAAPDYFGGAPEGESKGAPRTTQPD